VPVLYLRAEDGELFEGAMDAQVRDTARKAVEQLVVQQSVKVVQQHVEVINKFAPMTVNLGGSTPQEIKQSTPGDDVGLAQPSKVDIASDDSSEKKRPSQAESTAVTEAQNLQTRIELAGEALRPVLAKLIAELGQDDLPLAFQWVVDLSYELARDRDADVGLIERLVKSLVALVPGILPELHDLFRRDDFTNLTPSAALAEVHHAPSLSDATSPSSQEMSC
jgi:hypothetical protein